MKTNSDKSKQSKKATRRVLAGVLCGASVLSLVLSLVMPPISQAIANDAQTVSTEATVADASALGEDAGADENVLGEEVSAGNSTGKDAENQNGDDAEGGETGDGAAEMPPLSDDAEVESAAQPADDGADDENAIALASGNANGNIELQGDVTDKFNEGGSYCLTSDAWSTKPINIKKDTKINLAGHKLYYRVPKNETDAFITVESGALTIEDYIEDSGKSPVETTTTTTVNDKNPGQFAKMEWTSDNNGTTPQSLTYYETTSTPSEDKPGTTETTTKHVVSGFGAIVAASKSGSVKQVISVADGSTLNLNGGMITTPRALGNDGHVIFSQGAVYISGGYVTNGNDGGWGGGLCITGANASLEMTGGVVAGNKAASGGGIFANNSAALNLSGGVISGNATYDNDITDGYNVNAGGYGGGVYTQNAAVTISDSANITNNRAEARLANQELYNKGLLGGGGIASHGGTLSMTGGSVTANYSHEAGGGIYAGLPGQGVGFTMSSGFIAGNMSDNAEGGGLRISGDTTGYINTGDINAENASNRVYITNNKTMTGSNVGRGGDWGGGGVFIQKGGRLNIFKTLITNNRAGGWGGGVGACPTGETIVSHSNGAAIYDNTDNVDQNGNKLPAYHYSAGGDNKKEDRDEEHYVTPDFQNSGHKDFFLVRNKNGADKTIAVVLGKMLGGESAGWQGTCDGEKITIDANGGAEAKWMFGLEAHPNGEAEKRAQAEATTIISGNYSYTHGGGIMTNGDLTVGEVTSLDVYPAIKVKANKVLMKNGEEQGLSGHNYQFKLLGAPADPTKAPYWNENGTLNENGCKAMPAVDVDANGDILIDTGANYQSGDYDLYLVEVPPDPVNVPVNEKGTKFDKSIYKIHIKVGTTPVKWTDLLGIHINRYAVDGDASTVSVKKEDAADFAPCDDDFYEWSWAKDSHGDVVSTVKLGKSNSAFTNRQASGSWTPQVTKKVDGGEMKAFAFELANEDDPNFTNPKTVTINPDPVNAKTDKNGNATSTVNFKPKNYELTDLKNGSMTFTYYVREKNDHSTYPHYKFDQSVYKFTVVATDCTKEGKIKCKVTYKQIQDRDGKPVTTDTPHDLTESTPTFTNTYSTSLPLSGMSGVTLTYLAGAAVLCAAAAWMHIRRKANARGGERRE